MAINYVEYSNLYFIIGPSYSKSIDYKSQVVKFSQVINTFNIISASDIVFTYLPACPPTSSGYGFIFIRKLYSITRTRKIVVVHCIWGPGVRLPVTMHASVLIKQNMIPRSDVRLYN